jgi:di/tricarboxylate transporter
MFELTRVGVVIVAVGMFYMLLVGIRLLPVKKSAESLTEQYHVRQYMTEVIVLDDSPLIGKSLGEARISDEMDLTVLGILRGEEHRIAPHPREKIKADDLLLVQGRVEDILKVKAEAGIEIRPDFKFKSGRNLMATTRFWRVKRQNSSKRWCRVVLTSLAGHLNGSMCKGGTASLF